MIGAAPEIAKRELPKPAASLSFFLNTFDRPGILRPILKTAFESIAALRFEYIFSYIQKLYHLEDSNKSHARMFFEMKKISLKNIAKEHLEEDSEMAGIRGLTSDYSYQNIENLHLKVIFQELEAFDKELDIHSVIENKILFPRALDLEKSVADKIRNISFLN